MERVKTIIRDLPPKTQNWAILRRDQNLLTDSDLQNPHKLLTFHKRENVAFHEEGHAALARGLGWTVIAETVIPNGNTLGLTIASPNFSKSEDQLLLDAIAISAGGEMAEEMCGIEDHSGCGYDRGKQRFLASIYLMLNNSNQSVDSIISWQRNKARSILGSVGLQTHQQNSMALLRACA